MLAAADPAGVTPVISAPVNGPSCALPLRSTDTVWPSPVAAASGARLGRLPRTVTITSGEIREALLEPVNTIVEAVRDTLEKCPPELAADIIDRGIVLAGGGALLQGLDELISHDTEVPVHIADDPLSCVVLGTGKVLEDFATLKRVLGTGVEQ